MSKTITFRASEEVEALIEDISKQTGIPAKSDVIKMVLSEYRNTAEVPTNATKDGRIILKAKHTTDELLKELNDHGIEMNRFSKDYLSLNDRIKMLPVYVPKI